MREVKLEELTKKIDPIVEARNSCFLVTATDGTTVNTLTADYSGVPAHQVRSSAQPDHTPAHLS